MYAYRDVTEKSFFVFQSQRSATQVKVFFANFNSINSIGFKQLHKQSVMNDKVQRTQVGYLHRAHLNTVQNLKSQFYRCFTHLLPLIHYH